MEPEHLVLAVKSGSVPTVVAFLEAGLVPDSPGLLVLATDHSAKLVALLLDHGANPDDARADGTTALMRAAEQGKLRMVQRLLKAGADPALVDSAQRTAADRASGKNAEKVRALL